MFTHTHGPVNCSACQPQVTRSDKVFQLETGTGKNRGFTASTPTSNTHTHTHTWNVFLNTQIQFFKWCTPFCNSCLKCAWFGQVEFITHFASVTPSDPTMRKETHVTSTQMMGYLMLALEPCKAVAHQIAFFKHTSVSFQNTHRHTPVRADQCEFLLPLLPDGHTHTRTTEHTHAEARTPQDVMSAKDLRTHFRLG